MIPADTFKKNAEKASPPEPEETDKASRSRIAMLSLTALGVVYGDIGTSPLYAFREALPGSSPAMTRCSAYCRMIFWSLTIVVTLKYLLLLMRADNNGEGGILALAGAAQAVAAATKLQKDDADLDRRVRRRAALWRRNDHAGDFRAQRRGRPANRQVTGSTPSSFRSRSRFWPGSFSCSRGARNASAPISVRLPWSGSSCWPRSASFRSGTIRASSRALSPVYAVFFFVAERRNRLHHPGRGVSGGDRRRGALRGYGAFRQGADPPGLVSVRPAMPVLNYFGQGALRAGRSGQRGAAFLSASRPIGPATR